MRRYLRSHINFEYLQYSLDSPSVSNFRFSHFVNIDIFSNTIRLLDGLELLLRYCDDFAALEELAHLSDDLHLPIIRVTIEQNDWQALRFVASHSLLGLKLQSNDGFVDLSPKGFLTCISYFD